MGRRNDSKATVALVIAAFAAVVAVIALAVLFWSGRAGGASVDASPAPALQTKVDAETGGAAATPAQAAPTIDPQDAAQALERLRASAETLAATADSLAEMQINAMLLKLSGLQQEVESLRSGSARLAVVLETLTQALDGPVGNADASEAAKAASALEQSNTALNNEMAALKQAKQNKDLDAIGQGLERMAKLADEANAAAKSALALVQQ